MDSVNDLKFGNLNIRVLYLVYEEKLLDKLSSFNPKDLDIDLTNLESAGYIMYHGSVENATITEKGMDALDTIMAFVNRVDELRIEDSMKEQLGGK